MIKTLKRHMETGTSIRHLCLLVLTSSPLLQTSQPFVFTGTNYTSLIRFGVDCNLVNAINLIVTPSKVQFERSRGHKQFPSAIYLNHVAILFPEKATTHTTNYSVYIIIIVIMWAPCQMKPWETKASGVQFASGKASVAETVFQYGDASQASKKKSSLSTKASGVQLTASQSKKASGNLHLTGKSVIKKKYKVLVLRNLEKQVCCFASRKNQWC
ncbi:hypothetical protein Tco_0542863 [Tanacetum coccineum]